MNFKHALKRGGSPYLKYSIDVVSKQGVKDKWIHDETASIFAKILRAPALEAGIASRAF
jgi:hypothetical protein